MSLHPAWRLFIPAALFLVLVAAPRRPAAGGVDGPARLLSPIEEPVPDVPLEELYHDLVGTGPSGPAPALIVVEFSDFGCPYCAQFELGTFQTLRREFIETGRVRWRFVPFVLGTFPNGFEAMRAATCAAEQGEAEFWKMRDILFRKQDVWKASRDPDQIFRSYAVVSGADGDTFTACFDDPRSADRVTAANALARQGGVRATPTFLVGRQMLQGALPVADFRTVLEEALR